MMKKKIMRSEISVTLLPHVVFFVSDL